MTIQVEQRRSYGHDRFYAKNRPAEVILKLMKRTSFTGTQISDLKDYGHIVIIEQFQGKPYG